MAVTRSRSSRLRKADEGDLPTIREILGQHDTGLEVKEGQWNMEVYLWGGEGVFAVERLSPRVVRAHVTFREDSIEAYKAGMAALDEIDHSVMLVNIPAGNSSALLYAKRLGFEPYGETDEMKQYIRRKAW